jgi:CRISPR system Cascade subunit CasD
MQDYLVFQLYAPLASWGDQAVGQERPSADHPSRSALLGLIAAALGIERNDDKQHQALATACQFASKVYAVGLTMRDFHTAEVPPMNKKIYYPTRYDELHAAKLGTILSYRSYQQDSLSVVAVWINSNAEVNFQQIKQALDKPHYHLYLGRKSCPLAISLNTQLITADTLKAALDSYQTDKELEVFVKNEHRYYWEKPQDNKMQIGLQQTYKTPRYDNPISRKRWQFSSRDEYVYLAKGDH